MKPYSLILLIPFFITIQATSCPNLINSTCLTSARNDRHIDYAFCTTSLQAAPTSRCATLQGLGAITIKLIGYNLTDTRCYIKQLMESRKLDPDVKKCLHVCLEVYSLAIDAAKKALGYYKMKRFIDANIMLNGVLDEAVTCEDCFKEGKGVVSPLTKRNDDVFQLSDIALHVMHLVNQTGSAG